MRKLLPFILTITFLLVIDFAFGQGCSQCKLVAEQGADLDEGSFGNGINKGILFLMSIPYIILFIFFRKRIIGFFKSMTAKKPLAH